MISAAIYETATGKIIRSGRYLNEAEVADNVPDANHDWIEFEEFQRPRQYYVDSGAVTLRPTLPDLVEAPTGTWTLGSAPSGIQVEVWDREINQLITTVAESGGSVEITLPDPGPYSFRASHWPYLDFLQEVEVT